MAETKSIGMYTNERLGEHRFVFASDVNGVAHFGWFCEERDAYVFDDLGAAHNRIEVEDIFPKVTFFRALDVAVVLLGYLELCAEERVQW